MSGLISGSGEFELDAAESFLRPLPNILLNVEQPVKLAMTARKSSLCMLTVPPAASVRTEELSPLGADPLGPECKVYREGLASRTHNRHGRPSRPGQTEVMG